MTAQIPDSVEYRGDAYAIAGKNGGELFWPIAHGLLPLSGCTACWNGFVCAYAVHNRKLILDDLYVYLNDPAPSLFGVTPKKIENRLFDLVYEGLAHPIPYTGGLLLGADFIEELYVHMRFHPAWKYREVHELVFREGELVQEADRSEQMAEFRRKLSDRPLEPAADADQTEIKRWIEQCFSQKYGW